MIEQFSHRGRSRRRGCGRSNVDHYLREAGTSKSNLLTANLWIKDMALFRDMNAVWNDWVDPQNPPCRACVRADLARPEVLVEIMVTAAK